MNRPVTILYSQTWGDSMRCAHLLAGRLAREGHHVLAVDLTKYLASDLLAGQVALFCVEGGNSQSEEVCDLLDYLQELPAGDLGRLYFSVFSLDGAHRPNSGGAELNFLLKHLGGTRIVAHMACTVEFEHGFALWSDAVSDMLAFDLSERLSPAACLEL